MSENDITKILNPYVEKWTGVKVRQRVIIGFLIVIAVLLGSIAFFSWQRYKELARLEFMDWKYRVQTARNAEEKARQAEASMRRYMDTVKAFCPCWEEEPFK